MKRKRRYMDDGGEVDPDRLYGGQYDTMFVGHPKALEFVPRTISLGVDFVIPANMNAQALRWTGVQLAVCADLLERSGYRCNIRLLAPGKSNDDPGGWHLLDVSLKDGRDPLRLDLLALLTVPAISRRYILHAFAFTPDQYFVGQNSGKATGASYGRDKVRWQVDQCAKLFGYEAPDIVLQVVQNKQECLDAIRETLEICGVYEEERFAERKLAI